MAGDPIPVNEAFLRQWCSAAVEELPPSRAYEVAARLKNLAIWWLRPELLQRAAAHARDLGLVQVAQHWECPPRLPAERGTCWIAVVNQYHHQLPCLSSAYALPLRWAKQHCHDPRLPEGLRKLADQVLQELLRLDEVCEPWGLLPNPDSLLFGLDLSSLEGRWDSAWASLAVGLLLATWEGNPDPKLWASGAWTPGQGIQQVEGLESKLTLAARFDARAFFVPQSQVEDLCAWAQSHRCPVRVEPLLRSESDLRVALGEYLNQLDHPIGPGDHLTGKRAAHFLRIQDHLIAERFYRQHILPDLAEKLRTQVPDELACGGKKLITIVSQGFELVSLAVRVLRPAECLLLHDAELASKASKIQATIQDQAADLRITLGLIEGSTRQELLAAFEKHMKEYAPNARPEDLVIDVTAGKRVMNLALYDVAPQGSHIVCIQAAYHTGRPVPYTEVIHSWRKSSNSS